MKTKLFTLLLAVAANVGTIFAGYPIERGELEINGFYYLLDQNNYTASFTYHGDGPSYIYDYYSGDVSIPTSVVYNNKIYTVTSIGSSAFSGCTGLTSVTIPNSVTSIGYEAFSHCSGLTSVTIPNSVTSIEWQAFYGCSGLTSVTIPNSVTSIGWNAFYGCSGLTSVTIGNSVTSIGSEAFSGCTGLTSPVYNAHVFAFMPTTYSGAYTIPDGIASIASYAFRNCTGLTSVTIPNSVTSIGGGAFSGCTGLTSVTIGNGVRSIGSDAFSGCSGLTSVTIPNSVTSIEWQAFYGCSGLTSVTIPNSVTSIGWNAFYGCSGLTSVTIGNSVTSIGEYAFSHCSGLTSVTIPNSVTSIGGSAFEDCSSLTSVTIPNSVTSIGSSAFSGCTGLTSVIWNAKNYADFNYYNAPFYADYYDEERYQYIQFDLRSQITSFTFGNEVEHIPANLCNGMSNLTSIEIPNSVTSIGGGAFSGCTSLTNIFVTCGDLDRVKQLFNNDSRVKYKPLPYSVTVDAQNGTVSSPQNICDALELTATPNKGYHFTRWSDGDTHNPRTFTLTRDTTFIAVFEKNRYTITTASSNSEWGTTGGDKDALYLDEVEISATANSGYHFVKWNDGKTQNPRVVIVTEDKIYTATFAKNIYSITKNAAHGSISGNSSAEYLDEVTLTANPDYGYHFNQWSDGNTDNPRTITLASDTTFTAEFAPDRVGTCGKDLALVWSYDPTNKVLTIGNAGSFTENMQFGVEAPNEMEELVIGNSVTAIGTNAFAGIETLKKVSIGESVKTIGEQAFYNCVNLETIFNYRPTPTNTYSNAFDGVDKFECTLYVLPSSIDMYKNASVWRDFYYTYAIGEKPTAVEHVQGEKVQCTKILRNGQIYILRGDKTYTLQGQEVK